MPVTGGRSPLLQTKLFRTSISEDHVHRPRLVERLKQVGRYPLTIVSAPAGYGKSVLLSCWLEQCDCHGAWLSLDEDDNDLGSFESYFLAALQSAVPSFGNELMDLVGGARLPPTAVFVERLFGELDRLENDIFLMLDDYGAIVNEDVHEFISELMHHPHPRLHLVMATRYDPPLALSEWRGRKQLIEIRPIDMRFSLEETRAFLRRAIDPQLDEDTILALHDKTEGWIAGLRLAALSFTRLGHDQGYIGELSGTNVYVRDYLISQVLADLPADMQSFLIQTSILDRLSAPLCRDVTVLEIKTSAVQAMLEQLQAANLFIMPLDDLGQWYRYHHLFQQFLQTRLEEVYSAEDVAALHIRASAWFAEHGFIEEALQHALAAGDMEAAVQLVATKRQEMMNREQYQRLARWLGKFPPSIKDGSPDLLLLQARFAQIQRYDIAEMRQIVDKVDTLINTLDLEPHQARCYLAENNALRSVNYYYALEPQKAFNYCQSALAVLPQHWYALRSYCWLYGAVALQMMGDLSVTSEWINRGRREDLTVTEGPQARNAAAEGFVCWMAGDLTGLQRVGEFVVGVVSESSRWQSLGWAHYFLACVYYQCNDLDSAQYHAQQTFGQRHVNHVSANVISSFIMVLVRQARGRPDAANETLALAADYAMEIRSPTLMLVVQSFQAEIAVMQGRAREWNQWAEQANVTLQPAAMPFFYAPLLTIPKVLLAAGAPGYQMRVDSCLRQLHEFAEFTHNKRILIEVLALEAMLHDADDDEQAAFAALEQSLALAQPGGFIRLYVDLGPQMAGLLRRLPQRELHTAYINAILSSFADATALEPRSAGNGQSIESLTGRELEILELLAKRYSNKEIAAELVISPGTVKRHTVNIYQKLHVHNRRDAAEAAIALGLIPRP
jgi:LuxR family maltose regulon positive regulatory protein